MTMMHGRRRWRATVWWLLLLLLLSGVAGCARPAPSQGLVPADAAQAAAWALDQRVSREGAGGTARVLTGPGLSDGQTPSTAVELAAARDGRLIYTVETDGTAADMTLRVRFLSTTGVGRVSLTAYDEKDQPLGTVGWVFTGDMPPTASGAHWLDMRQPLNFLGGWFTFSGSVRSLFDQYLPMSVNGQAKRCVLAVEAGQGQHVLINAAAFSPAPATAVRFTAAGPAEPLAVGDTAVITGVVENISATPVQEVTVTLVEPYGAGVISLDGVTRMVQNLAPGEKRSLSWQVWATRPDAVNLSRPWRLAFTVDGREAETVVPLAVQDPAPGTIYYVMTDDLEPIDSAGYPVAWGNGNGWLDPEELYIQLVQKPAQMNAIADKYGAKWSHYIAWPAVTAAAWAADRSSTGAWPLVIAAIEESVRRGAAAGHEYAPHLHSDYDPRLPGNVLSYDPGTDGFWGDHRQHGWAHSLPAEGDYGDFASRTGFLYYYLRQLAALTADTQGQILATRAGSFDFGTPGADAAASIRAYRRLGLWGSSDADGNVGGITARDYGQNLYFTRPDDINAPADDLHAVGLVEFCPTPRDFIQYDRQSAADMNARADQGVAAFTRDGRVLPGVHAIVGFTHAMFIMGQPDWRSVTGGQFDALDAHLAHMKEYADRGLIRFATASTLVRAYLDYYTPELLAVYGPRQQKGWGVSEYPLTLLGRGIVADAAHPRMVRVACPPYLRDTAYRAEIRKNGAIIYQTWGLPTPNNDLVFTVDDNSAQYSLRVYHNGTLKKLVGLWQRLRRFGRQMLTIT